MLADGLVDDLHLFVFPLAHGTGQRLFPDGGPVTKFALAGAEPTTTESCTSTTPPLAVSEAGHRLRR
jgi:dihydrofolate reductase